MKNLVLLALVAVTAVTVGCERNSIKSRSFAVRSKTLIEQLKAENATILATCEEKDSVNDDIQLIVYGKPDKTGKDMVGVKGAVKALSILPNGGNTAEIAVNETVTMDEVVISDTELSVVKTPVANQPSALIIKIGATSQEVRVVLDDAGVITNEHVECKRVASETPSAPQTTPTPTEAQPVPESAAQPPAAS